MLTHESRQLPSWLIFDVRQEMHPTLLVILFLTFAPLSLPARLGETDEELRKRFGSPKATGPEKLYLQGKAYDLGLVLTFQQQDWTIQSTVIDGRSVREFYTKRGEWTESQIATVLTSNAQGLKWTEATKGDRRLLRRWRREDGATAEWTLNRMTVIHPAHSRAVIVLEAKAKAEVSRPARI